MNYRKRLVEQIKNDIARLGGNYPVMAILKNQRIVDYRLSTEVKVIDDENALELTLAELLAQLTEE